MYVSIHVVLYNTNFIYKLVLYKNNIVLTVEVHESPEFSSLVQMMTLQSCNSGTISLARQPITEQ